jgi:hypothetical protein
LAGLSKRISLIILPPSAAGFAPQKRRVVKMSNEKKEITQIYDKILKRILILSKAAVINFINGLFDRDYPLDSDLAYNWTENIDDRLEKTIADAIITVNGTEKFHIEVQINNDNSIVVRMFGYGYQEALKYRKILGARIVLEFPEPKIIVLEHNSKTADEVVLELDFRGQGSFEYKVPVMKFLDYSIEELDEKHMVILLPLYLLKLRREANKNPTRENALKLKNLIECGIIPTIEKNEKAGNISHEDCVVLFDLLKLLYEYLYRRIEAFEKEEVDSMITERLVLPYEIWQEKCREEGVVEGKKAVAVSLFGLLPDEVIAEKTGLTLDELNELKNAEIPV